MTLCLHSLSTGCIAGIVNVLLHFQVHVESMREVVWNIVQMEAVTGLPNCQA